jgi:predicted permease
MWQDLAYAFRTLRRTPVFTIAAVLSLALGIGANTAIFSLLDQVVLRSLPVRDPERLVVLHKTYDPPGTSTSDNHEAVFSYPLYKDLRDRDPAFAGLLGRMSAQVRLAWHGSTEAAHAEIVTGGYFSTLGVGAAMGRVLAPEDDGAPGAHPVAVLAHSYWTAHMGASPAVLNQTVAVNGHPFVIVGVAEPRFSGLIQGDTPDLFVPAAMQRAILPTVDILEKRDFRWLTLFARLKPGETARQAQAATDVVYHSILVAELARMERMRDDRSRNEFLNHRTQLLPAAQGISELRDKWEKPLRVLSIMVTLVLLIACANVAGLLVARAAGRQKEIAIRLAVGASRAALVRQLVIEGLVLSIAGGALGLMVEHFSTAALVSILPRDEAGSWLQATLDFHLLVYALAVSVACGVAFALVPALQATRPVLAGTLKDQASSVQAGGRPARFRQALVTAQLALSLLLVVGAGLFSVSAANLLHANLGLRTEHLLSFNVNATLGRPDLAPAVAFYRDLLDRLAALPGVAAVGAADTGPFTGGNSGGNITVEGYRARDDEYTGSSLVAVSPGYFHALGIPLRAGREFTERDDAAAPKAVVINEAFAKRYFGNQNPIGRRMQLGASNPPKLDREIVGVVADSRGDVRTPAKETFYYPFAQWDKPTRLTYYVRAAGQETPLVGALRQTVHAADANLPVPTIKTVEVKIRESLYTDRLIAILSAAFGILATLLAAIGLYGVIAYAVARRTGEIGLRMALGARPAMVLRMILLESAKMAGLGIALGLGAAVVLSRFVESQLFGIQAGDPAIYAAAVLVLGTIAIMAALVPGWRAARIDPVSALKHE